MSKHTPGPWSVVEHDHAICIQTESPSKTKYGASRYAAIGGFDRNDLAQLEEARANARLIAAALELLEALVASEALMRHMDKVIDWEFGDCRSEAEMEADNAWSAEVYTARAAITKATGEKA